MLYIISCTKSGQLCNRLFQFAELIVFSHKYNVQILNPAIEDYSEYFRLYRNTMLPSYPRHKFSSPHVLTRIGQKLIYAMASRVFRMFEVLNITESDFHKTINAEKITQPIELNEEFYESIKKFKLVFLKGWRVQNENYSDEALKAVLDQSKFLKKYYSEADLHIDRIRKTGSQIIGVHIRRGDYQFFEQGKHYFSVDRYLKWMNEMDKIAEKNLVFAICSNEDLSSNKALNSTKLNVDIANGNLISDLILLSKCDYIIGPPSTYSMWASFMGKRPLQMIRGSNHKINHNLFKIYKPGETQP